MFRFARIPMRMGGHGHGSRYPGTLFGEPVLAKGESRKWAPWEFVNAAVFVSVVGLLVLGSQKTSTNQYDWARDEARERRRRIAEGKEVLYGVNYAGIRWLRETNQITNEEADRLEAGEYTADVVPNLRVNTSL